MSVQCVSNEMPATGSPFSEQLLSFSSLLAFSFSYLPSNGSLLVFYASSHSLNTKRERDGHCFYPEQSAIRRSEYCASTGEHLQKGFVYINLAALFICGSPR